MSFDDPSFAQFRSHIAGVVWPPVSTGTAATLAVLLDAFDSSQWLDPAAIRELQFRQLRALAEYCVRHSPYFARRLDAAGLTPAALATPEGLLRLPPLRRRDLQDATDLFCDEVPAGHAPLREMHSSGSTGEPVRVLRTGLCEMMWLAHMVRDEIWHRRDLKGRRCSIRAVIADLVRFPTWGGIAGELFETGEVLAVPSRLAVAEQAARIDAFRPESLLAYPNVLAALLEECRARGRSFEGLGHLRTMGETLSPDLREGLATFFGAKVTDSYSGQEIGYLALQCPDSPLYHVMAETVIIELVRDDGTPCGEGEVGHVLVTDLHNLATPIIRYEIGDYAEAGPPCPCGRGLPTLRRIMGRERNLAHLPDGRRLWPWFANAELRGIAPVRQFQVIQHDIDRMELRLVCDRPLSGAEEARMRTAICKVLDHDMVIDISRFDDALPLGSGGKFEEFICMIGAT
jgi:phenylacetate-CoA ligase